MGEHKRLSGKFCWLPPEKRPDRIPGPPPPRKPETRKPLYFLVSENNELYFVNYSNDILTEVSSTAGGIWTVDEDCDELVPVGGPAYKYESVQPKEAVKIEQYDPMSDSDFIMQVKVTVSHPSLGEKVFRAGKKGGISKEVVLLWDNGDLGKDVY